MKQSDFQRINYQTESIRTETSFICLFLSILLHLYKSFQLYAQTGYIITSQ
jgi:hypothetical protein